MDKDQEIQRSHLRLVDNKLQAEKEEEKAEVFNSRDLMQIVNVEMEWDNALYHAVAAHFLAGTKDIYDPVHVMQALSLWRRFSTDTWPQIRKLGSYAAALDYMIITMYGYDISQAQLAEKYGVSVATISKNYNNLYEFALAFKEESPSNAAHNAASRMDMEREMRNMERLLSDQQF